MSDRLNELLRQRALIEEHLAWLNREIAGAANRTPGSPPLPPPAPAPALAPAAPTSTAHAATAAGASADAILEKYRVTPRALQQDVRRGCFLYFTAAFLLFALGVTALYLALRSR